MNILIKCRSAHYGTETPRSLITLPVTAPLQEKKKRWLQIKNSCTLEHVKCNSCTEQRWRPPASIHLNTCGSAGKKGGEAVKSGKWRCVSSEGFRNRRRVILSRRWRLTGTPLSVNPQQPGGSRSRPVPTEKGGERRTWVVGRESVSGSRARGWKGIWSLAPADADPGCCALLFNYLKRR